VVEYVDRSRETTPPPPSQFSQPPHFRSRGWVYPPNTIFHLASKAIKFRRLSENRTEYEGHEPSYNPRYIIMFSSDFLQTVRLRTDSTNSGVHTTLSPNKHLPVCNYCTPQGSELQIQKSASNSCADWGQLDAFTRIRSAPILAAASAATPAPSTGLRSPPCQWSPRREAGHPVRAVGWNSVSWLLGANSSIGRTQSAKAAWAKSVSRWASNLGQVLP